MTLKLELYIVFVILSLILKSCFGFDDDLLFSVTRSPKYLGVLQDHRDEPLSVELSEDYMDHDYLTSQKKRHKLFNKNLLDFDDADEDDSEDETKIGAGVSNVRLAQH